MCVIKLTDFGLGLKTTMFNFLKKDVVVNCYTWDSSVYNYAPIKPAISFIPTWWKELPKSFASENNLFEQPTMKGCTGFTNLYKQGFIMPMWSDLAIRIGHEGSTAYAYKFSCERGEISVHPVPQRGLVYPETKYQHLKIATPWIFTCNEEVQFLQTGVPWDDNCLTDATILPGIVDYKYQIGTHINTIWKRAVEDKKYIIAHQTPLCHFIPLTERKVKIKQHLVTKEKFAALLQISTRTTFLGKYKTNKRLLKERGCPFHFESKR